MTGSLLTGSVEQVQAILASSLPVIEQQPISTPRLTCTPIPAPRKALVSRACQRARAARPHALRCACPHALRLVPARACVLTARADRACCAQGFAASRRPQGPAASVLKNGKLLEIVDEVRGRIRGEEQTCLCAQLDGSRPGARPAPYSRWAAAGARLSDSSVLPRLCALALCAVLRFSRCLQTRSEWGQSMNQNGEFRGRDLLLSAGGVLCPFLSLSLSLSLCLCVCVCVRVCGGVT